jgi:hypothetical protein
VQYEGTAIEPEGEEQTHAKDIYFQTWPSGVERQQWSDITWFLVNPIWIRYSDFDTGHREEMRFSPR